MSRTLPLLALLVSSLTFASTTQAVRLRPDERTRGHSGALKVSFAELGEVLNHTLELGAVDAEDVTYHWTPVEGTPGEPTAPATHAAGFRTPNAPGVWRLDITHAGVPHPTELVVVTRIGGDAVKDGLLNGYRIGRYPAGSERLGDEYAPPSSFIEVTRENKDLALSENFRLGQFLTKDQANVWPKYVALDLQLVDKLELVLAELRASGIDARRLHVMSGFRTPQYNGPGGKSGRAKYSRHTYGDASDVWVDSDGDGYMDDLNGDGKRDLRDADVLLAAVERVEKQYPELTGGAGVYRANRAHGPFVHIDARGRAARWSKR